MPRMKDPVSRYELNSRLSAQEARTEARVAHIEASVAELTDIATRIQHSCEGIRCELKDVENKMEKRCTELRDEMNAKFSSMTLTLIATAVTSVAAVIFGVASFNASLTSNMLSAFQIGGTMSKDASSSRPAPGAGPGSNTP